MNQYIITEERLNDLKILMDYACGHYINPDSAYETIKECFAHPYNPQAERELSHISSTDLLLISHDEWKRREERKHIHDRVDWTAGWISGFLTSRKFVKDRLEELRQGKDGE